MSKRHSYTWSARGELQAEYTEGYAVRTFSWDAGGRLISATVFTLTTHFTYTGDGTRVAVGVEGYGTTAYVPDYARRMGVLVEDTGVTQTLYLYGRDCLAERRDGEWLYHLFDGTGYVRQVAGADGEVVSAWVYDPDGVVQEGPEGPVSHLVCGGIYDWSTGLIYKDGHYFDALLGIGLAVGGLVMIGWPRKRKKKGGKAGGFPWYVFLLVGVVVVSGTLAACVPEQPKCPLRPTELPEWCVDPGFTPQPPLGPPPILQFDPGPGVRIHSRAQPLPYQRADQRPVGFGGFWWEVAYELEGPAIYELQIMQEAEAKTNTYGPPSRDLPEYEHFLEAWSVTAGGTKPNEEASGPRGVYNDIFASKSSRASHGERHYTGKVKTYYACPYPLDKITWYREINPEGPSLIWRTDDVSSSERWWWQDGREGTAHELHIWWNGIMSWGDINYKGYPEHFEIGP